MSTKAPNPVDKYVGSRVRMRRIMLGMSQEKLGEALGLTFQQVQKYEKGTNRVGASRIQQISEILQVPVSFLFEGGPSGTASADGFSEGASPSYVSDFLATSEGLALDPRLHPHHRCQASAQHRRHGRADRRARRPRQALRPDGFRAASRTGPLRLTRIELRAHDDPAESRPMLSTTSMTATSQSVRRQTILDGIRRWVEIETPTEAPEQVNRLATLVADGYRDLPATIERIAGRDGCGDHLVARSAWGQDEPGILVLSHLDTVHPMGFIERLPFHDRGRQRLRPRHLRHEGRRLSRFSRVPAALRRAGAFAARHHPALRLRRRDRQPDLARADRGRGPQGQICAGDRACPRRRQNRHRTQGRRALRGFHQRHSRPCRHAARRTAAARSANSPISFRHSRP